MCVYLWMHVSFAFTQTDAHSLHLLRYSHLRYFFLLIFNTLLFLLWLSMAGAGKRAVLQYFGVQQEGAAPGRMCCCCVQFSPENTDVEEEGEGGALALTLSATAATTSVAAGTNADNNGQEQQATSPTVAV